MDPDAFPGASGLRHLLAFSSMLWPSCWEKIFLLLKKNNLCKPPLLAFLESPPPPSRTACGKGSGIAAALGLFPVQLRCLMGLVSAEKGCSGETISLEGDAKLWLFQH